MLHTAIRDAVGTLPIKAVNHESLPKTNYLALGHLHINYAKNNAVYSGPIFPNNLSELEDLKAGSFYIFDNGYIKREEIKLKGIVSKEIEIKDAFNATSEILASFKDDYLKDKIVILKLLGALEKGKSTDIDFGKIEEFVKTAGAYVFLKSTTKLHLLESEIKMDNLDYTNLESQIVKKFEETNNSKFNSLIPEIMKALSLEKIEDERSVIYEDRLLSEVKKVLPI